jgi:plasmid stability protein
MRHLEEPVPRQLRPDPDGFKQHVKTRVTRHGRSFTESLLNERIVARVRDIAIDLSAPVAMIFRRACRSDMKVS